MTRARGDLVAFDPETLDDEQRALGGVACTDLAAQIAAQGPLAVRTALAMVEAATVPVATARAAAERETRARALVAERAVRQGVVLEPDQLEAIIVSTGLRNMRSRMDDVRARGEKTLERVWLEKRRSRRAAVRDARQVNPEGPEPAPGAPPAGSAR